MSQLAILPHLVILYAELQHAVQKARVSRTRSRRLLDNNRDDDKTDDSDEKSPNLVLVAPIRHRTNCLGAATVQMALASGYDVLAMADWRNRGYDTEALDVLHADCKTSFPDRNTKIARLDQKLRRGYSQAGNNAMAISTMAIFVFGRNAWRNKQGRQREKPVDVLVDLHRNDEIPPAGGLIHAWDAAFETVSYGHLGGFRAEDLGPNRYSGLTREGLRDAAKKVVDMVERGDVRVPEAGVVMRDHRERPEWTGDSEWMDWIPVEE